MFLKKHAIKLAEFYKVNLMSEKKASKKTTQRGKPSMAPTMYLDHE